MAEPQRQPADAASPSADESSPNGRRRSFWRRGSVIVFGTLVLVFLFFLGLRYLAEGFTHESTDDASLDGQIISIAPKVAGQVKQVVVTNNQAVKAGELVVEIDPRDLVITFEQKRAAVQSAKANVELLHASVELFRAQIATAEATARQSAAEVAAAQALAEKASADLKRAENLLREHTISPQDFDNAKAAAAAAQANLAAAQEKAASDQSKIAQANAQFEAGRRAYERGVAQTREAELEQKAAELNVSYAQVGAPDGGFVTRKAVENGDYVQVGQKLMALVTTRLWVTANFKETQLPRLRVGQPVSISIDSVAGKTFRGRVQSVQAGSGARFSLLPPENAVGNFVKIVQRVPVRIEFDNPLQAEHVLGPGMSVVPSVRVKQFEISEILLAIGAAVLGVLAGILWWMLANRSRQPETD